MTFHKINLKAKVHINGPMVSNMKVIGLIINLMAKENLFFYPKKLMKINLKKKLNIYIMKVILLTVKSKVLVNS